MNTDIIKYYLTHRLTYFTVMGLFLLWSGVMLFNTLKLVINPLKIPTYHQAKSLSPFTLKELSGVFVMGDAPKSVNDLPLASLGVTLTGIFNSGSHNSSIVVQFRNGQTKVLSTGDSIISGAVIKTVLTDNVVVEHNGHLERLLMPVKPITFSNTLPKSGLWQSH